MLQARLSTFALCRALLSALAVLCAMALAPAASAGALARTVGVRCEFPRIESQNVDLDLDVSAPATWPIKLTTEAFPLVARIELPATTREGLELLDVASVEGSWTVLTTLTLSGGFDLEVEVPLEIPRTELPADGAFELQATGSFPPLSFPKAGDVRLQYTDSTAYLTFRNAAGVVRQLPEVSPDVLGGNPGVAEVRCPVVSDPQQFVLTTAMSVIIDPFPPVPWPVATDITETTAKLCWSAVAANGPVSYEVYLGSTKVTSTTSTCVTLTGLSAQTAYEAGVATLDDSGVLSARGTVQFTTSSGPPPAPTPPGQPVISDVTATSAKVCWAPSQSSSGTALSYDVFLFDTKVARVASNCTTLTGLPQRDFYSITVEAFDGEQYSAASPAGTWRLVIEEPAPVKYGYGVSGAAQLKNLTRGSVPLSGSVDAELTLATGDFSAELSLQRSTANLVALGFLPVVAKVDVVPTVPVTGNLGGGVLTAATKVRIKLPQVTLFGLQLAGGSNCQTRSASAINLKSVGEFDALDGGTLAGTFSISDLTGCGVLTGLVSPLTSGPGNTIALKLAPASS